MNANLLDERDYREKNTWRRWVWNRLVERLDVPVASATAMYLASEANLDEPVLTAKGFRSCNLVPVERSQSKVESLRNRGVLCLHADIFEAAMNWKRPIHALNLDFCCGLEVKLYTCINEFLLCWPSIRRNAIAVNMLRGRDPSSNKMRENFVGSDTSFQLTRLLNVEEKHRGYLLFMRILFDVFRGCHDRPEEVAVRYMETHLHAMRPAFYSYRSSTNQTFDTVVFCHPWRALTKEQLAMSKDEPWMAAACKGDEKIKYDTELTRKIAAFRAHQTIRRKKRSGSKISEFVKAAP